MIASRLHRRLLLCALPLLATSLLAGCGDDAPAASATSAPSAYAAPNYQYLTPLKLNVAQIEIDDSWSPRGAARRAEHLAPYTPRFALKRMAEDRLVAGGNTGRAVFLIEDASIVRAPRHYEGSLAVRLDIADSDGTLLGKATARVAKVRPITGDSARAEKDELYAFVRDLMDDMNVEFEFQVRQAMKDSLPATSTTVPQPEAVDTHSLDNPPAADAGPTAGAVVGSDDDLPEGPAVPLSVDTSVTPAAPPPAPAPAPRPGAPTPLSPTPLRPPG